MTILMDKRHFQKIDFLFNQFLIRLGNDSHSKKDQKNSDRSKIISKGTQQASKNKVLKKQTKPFQVKVPHNDKALLRLKEIL